MKNMILAIGLLATLASCKKGDAYNNDDSPLMMIMNDMDDSMMAGMMTKDPDHDFAMMMKQHHMGAVNMTTFELANGSDATLKDMAQMMKNAQLTEIAALDSFLRAHEPRGMVEPMADSLDAAMKSMSSQADALPLKGTTDHDFAHLMIVHHRSAVEMAKSLKMYGINSFTRNAADMIIVEQNREIAELQAWLNKGKD